MNHVIIFFFLLHIPVIFLLSSFRSISFINQTHHWSQSFSLILNFLLPPSHCHNLFTKMGKNTKKNTTTYEDVNDNTWFWLIQKGTTTTTFTTITLFALLIRFMVSLYPYSGSGNPPKFGDFEAQRHWMEITINVPIREWYRNGTDNDLSYWGLDYPPLTAYQSFLHGIFLRFFCPHCVSLFDSRGHESYLG